MEYYLAIKRNGVLIHATTWMILKNMLSERSQTHILYDSIYMKCPRIGQKIYRDRKWISGCLGLGEGLGW